MTICAKQYTNYKCVGTDVYDRWDFANLKKCQLTLTKKKRKKE